MKKDIMKLLLGVLVALVAYVSVASCNDARFSKGWIFKAKKSMTAKFLKK